MGWVWILIRQQLRYFWRQTLLAMLGITVGVYGLLVVLSFAHGLEDFFIEQMLALTPHVSLEAGINMTVTNDMQSQIEGVSGVVAVAPYLRFPALIQRGLAMESVLVKGVDWVQENDLHGLRQMLKAGDWSIIQARAGVIVGAELGRLLAVEVGDMIQLTAPNQTLRLPVTGLFFTGFYANDAALVITDLATAESLWGIEGLTGYAVNVADLALVDSYILPLQRATNLWVKPWYQQQPALYIGLAVQRKVIILIVLFVFLVALLGIASIFSLRLLTQQKSIGILRALGARPCHIWQIFVGQALICGGLGGMIGLAGAYLTVLYLARYPISLPQVYYMQTLPIAWAHGDVGLVLVAAIVTSVLALLYPAYRFSRILPAEVIRNG